VFYFIAGSCRDITARIYFISLHMKPELQQNNAKHLFLQHLFYFIAHETTPLLK